MNSTTVTLPTETDIRVERRFDAPVGLVYEAHTKPEHLKKWMHWPGGWKLTEAQMDVRVGGAYQWDYTNGDEKMSVNGAFSVVEPEKRLARNEDWGPYPSPDVDTTFEEVDGQTLVVATYTLKDKEARDMVCDSAGITEALPAAYDALDGLLPTL